MLVQPSTPPYKDSTQQKSTLTVKLETKSWKCKLLLPSSNTTSLYSLIQSILPTRSVKLFLHSRFYFLIYECFSLTFLVLFLKFVVSPLRPNNDLCSLILFNLEPGQQAAQKTHYVSEKDREKNAHIIIIIILKMTKTI